MKKLFIVRIFIWVSIIFTHIFILNQNLYSQFQQEWVKHVNGNLNGADYGRKIVIDKFNNIYVAVSIYNSTDYDFALIKYNSSGTQLWIKEYDGTANSTDIVRDIVLDYSGNIYLTGESTGIGTAFDCLTIKYDTAGNLIWVRRYDSGINKNENGRVIKHYGNNIYVFGACTNLQDKDNYLLIKYDTSGNQKWVRTYFDVDDISQDMILDKIGNIYVTGTSFTMGLGWDIGIIKYSQEGNVIWSRRFDYNNGNGESPNSIAIDSLNNIVITGFTMDRFTYYKSILTVKYDSSGSLIWNRVYFRNQINNYDVGSYICADKNNNLYVTGYITKNDLNDRDYITIKYKSNGDTAWIRTYGGPGNQMDYPNSLVIDNRNFAYITGQSYGSGTNFDYFTIVYDTLGNTFWSNRYNGISNQSDCAYDIKLDETGNIYITGSSSTSSGLDVTTIKYSRTIGIQGNYQIIPERFKLFQNYPNPFNPSTSIKYQVASIKFIKLVVYDILGKEVTTLVNEKQKPGIYEVNFDGSNIVSGIYFYRLITDEFSDSKKMILIK